MIVVDASAALSALLNAGAAREALGDGQLHAPHLIDAEVASGLRRHVASGSIGGDAGWAALETWARLGLTRYATHGLLDRVWALRGNLSAYDAGYVALAETLRCSLVTADARINRAPGVRCRSRWCPGRDVPAIRGARPRLGSGRRRTGARRRAGQRTASSASTIPSPT